MLTRTKYLAIAAALSAAMASSVEATVFAVTKTADDGSANTLRWAIDAANNQSGADVINIIATGTILLLQPLPDISSNITINGPGPGQLTISPKSAAAQTTALIEVDSNAVAAISNIRLANGPNRAVHNQGTLTLTNCRLINNSVTSGVYGGAILNNSQLTLLNCLIQGNSAPVAGGAIENLGVLDVKQTTINNNTAFGEPQSGFRNALGGAIYDLGGDLNIISSTISGNVAIGSDGVGGSSFLTRKGSPQDQDAAAYYNMVDPLHRRATLGDWWTVNGFDVAGSASDETKAAYLNDNDLGFGRDMHMRTSAKNVVLQDGRVVSYVSSYVSNYSLDPPRADQNPLSADAAKAKDPARSIATVCMEYSHIENTTNVPVVKFFVYNGTTATAPLSRSADLDGNGQKFVPQLCMVCHGGSSSSFGSTPTLQDLIDHPSSFREFDISTFKLARPGTRADDPSRTPTSTAPEQADFKSLNKLVLETHPVPGIEELIRGWYNQDLSRSAQNVGFVPIGWRVTNHPEVRNLYTNVVAKSCRTCHVAQVDSNVSGIDFTSYDGFNRQQGSIKFDVLIAQDKSMPHARVTFSNFWMAARQNKLADFSGPASANAPAWTPLPRNQIAGDDPGGSARGGAIWSDGSVHIVASTIALNRSIAGIGRVTNGEAIAGGISSGNPFTQPDVFLSNTLLANNFVDGGVFKSQDIGFSVTEGAGENFGSQGYNLIGTNSGAQFQASTGDIVGVADARIGPLAQNGGFNPTHALLPGSPALEKGAAVTDPTNAFAPLTTDQRGFPRPVDNLSVAPASGGNSSDIGAVEMTGFDTETLTHSQSSGVTFGIFGDARLSGAAGSILNATAPGQFVSYTVPISKTGTYHIKVGVKKQNNKGMFQLSVNGVNKGAVQNEYASALTYPAALDLGSVTFTSTGNQTFKFTVTGKDAKSTAYGIDFDYIDLTP